MVRNGTNGLSLQGRWFFSSVFLANGVQWDNRAFIYKHFLTNWYICTTFTIPMTLSCKLRPFVPLRTIDPIYLLTMRPFVPLRTIDITIL